MKTTLIVIGSSALSATIAWNAGRWVQNRKDTKVFKATMNAILNVFKAETMQEADDIVTTLEMELKEF